MKNIKPWKTIKKLYIKYLTDDIAALGAQVAYYLVLAFFPFLIFIVTVVSYTKMVAPDSLSLLSMFLPQSVYLLILDIVQSVLQSRNSAFMPLSMIFTIWSASSGVLAFMYGMNKAYKRKETRPFLKVRGIAVLFTLALALIILLSIVFVVFGELLGKYITRILGVTLAFETFWDIFRYSAFLLTLFIVFILFYLYIPNYRLRTKEVLPGAVLSTAGWLILSAGFAFYVNNFMNFSKTYGSIGAAIALLIWLYWSSEIVFIGSELNAILLKEQK